MQDVSSFQMLYLLVVLTWSMNVFLVQAVDVINDTALGIVAGVDCTAEEVPYLVSIQTLKQYHWCGGTLLSQKWVLTAAHCCTKKSSGKLMVHTGLSSLSRASVQSSRVVQQFAHPKYQGEHLKNDVCLLKLKTPIFESDNIYYTHLANRLHWALHRMDHCEHGLVLGFGYRGDVHLNGTVATPYKRFDTKLQCANLSIVADDLCNKQYAFDNSMFCAIDFVKRKPGPCSGDSGGPLICKGIQYGVISAAVGCGVGWYPTLFARVDIHMEFFEAIIANKCERTVSFSIFYFIFILRLIVLNPI